MSFQYYFIEDYRLTILNAMLSYEYRRSNSSTRAEWIREKYAEFFNENKKLLKETYEDSADYIAKERELLTNGFDIPERYVDEWQRDCFKEKKHY